MKFIISKKKLLFYVVSFMFLLETNFFYLVDFGRLNAWVSRSSRALPGIIAIGILLVCSSIYNKYRKRFLTNYTLLFTICMISLFVFSIIQYDRQSFGTTAHLLLNYFLFYLTIPIYLCLINGFLDSFFKFLNFLAFIWYVIMIVQSYMLRISDGTFLINYFTNGMSIRNDRVRIMVIPFMALILVINYTELINKEKLILNNKFFSLIQVILGSYCIVIIQQSRSTILIFAILFGAIYYINSKGGLHTLIRVMILGVLGWKVYNSQPFSELLKSFDLKGDAGISTYARIQAIQYYLRCFINNPLFGIGFPDDRLYPYIAHGDNRICYVSDVGLIGMIGEMGFLGIILFVFFTYRLVKILKKSYRHNFYLKNTLISIFLFYILNLFSWYIYLPACISMLPIIFAVFEYCDYEINRLVL